MCTIRAQSKIFQQKLTRNRFFERFITNILPNVTNLIIEL